MFRQIPSLSLAQTSPLGICLENLQKPSVISYRSTGVLAPWKVDGTDSGRVSIQSNGVLAHVQV
jgi:hypothetical protein